MTSDNTPTVRVLYVEDDSSLRYTLRKMLEFYGYEVETAENGQEGVEKALSWQPDVIFMDIRMPIMSGVEALTALRANPQTKHIPVYMLSAHTDAKTRQSCAEADGFFTKPPNIQKIDEMIKKITQNK